MSNNKNYTVTNDKILSVSNLGERKLMLDGEELVKVSLLRAEQAKSAKLVEALKDIAFSTIPNDEHYNINASVRVLMIDRAKKALAAYNKDSEGD